MSPGWHARARGRSFVVVALVVIAATVTATPALGKQPNLRFKTDAAAMLTALIAGAGVEPLITVGDELGKFTFEALPDGISFISRSSNVVDVFVNHEGSTVPFPYSNPPSASNLNDFSNSLVSSLRINRNTHRINRAKYVIDYGDTYHRFCSNFLAGPAQGFETNLLLTNEEGTDWVNRSGIQWPVVVGDDGARQIGLVVAHDIKKGKSQPIWGMGRFNHENTLALKGYGHPVTLAGDDTFLTNPAASQAYMYTADSADAVWNDTGTLWAFASNDAAINDAYDFAPGSTASVSGHFIAVPKEIATGRNPDGTDMMAADVPAALGGPYPAPVAGDMTNAAGTTTPVDGPQWVLEHWSDLNGVFQFVRLEDMAYDKRPGMSNVVYMVDSGRGLAGAPGTGISTNGRIWKLVLDPTDPTVVTSLSILIGGDDSPVKTLTEIRQPDNIESTKKGLYITEDPGSSQHFAAGDPAGVTARVWQYRFSDGVLTPVFAIDQSADEGLTDVDTSTVGNLGSWEASGIIDVSSIFGPGMFLIDVQAHTLFINTASGPDLAAPAGPDWTYKREGGQLLLIHIPGA